MSVTVRTNRATNPTAAAASTNWVSVSGTGGNASSAHNAGAGYDGNGFVRVTWTVATSAVSGGVRYTQTGLSAATQYSHQMFVKSSKTQTVRLSAQYQDAGAVNVGALVDGPVVALVAGVWTRVRVAALSGAGVDRVQLTCAATTGGALWANGDTLDGDLVCVEVPAALRTNLCTNGSFEVGTAGWTLTGLTATSTSIFPQMTQVGTGIVQATSNGTSSAPNMRAVVTGVAPGDWLGMSSFMAAENIGNIQVRLLIEFRDATTNLLSIGSTYQTAGFYTGASLSVLGQAPAGTTQAYIYLQFRNGDATGSPVASGQRFWADAVLCVKSSTQTGVQALLDAGYFDGSTVGGNEFWWMGPADDAISIETVPLLAFHGSFTAAAGVLYAWTGTVNASTSTATLYTPVLTLVAKLDAPTDRVEITVTDLTPTENVVTLWRTADGKRVAVVDARRVEVTGSDFFEDFACPLGRLLTYDLEVFSGAGSGAPNSSSTVTVNATSGWIQDPIVPASSIRVYADAAPAGQPVLADDAAKSLQYKSDVALFQVLGTAEPVAVIGQRQAAGSVSFAMDTETAAQGTALRDLILQSPLLLVRPLPAWGAMLPGLCYIAPDSPEEQPFNISWGGGIEGWKITAPLVNPPATGILVPTNTYGTVQALWTTYQQAQTALTGDTYLDVRKSPSGA